MKGRRPGYVNIHARAELHNTESLPYAYAHLRHETADDSARQKTDDLSKDYNLPLMLNPDLALFVFACRLLSICRKKSPPLVAHPRYTAAYRYPVHVNIERG